MGAFSWPAPLKWFFLTCLHLFGPRLAIALSPCLHGSRWGGRGNRSFSRGLFHDGSLRNSSLCRCLCYWSLSHRNRHSSHTRPTGARGLGLRLHLRLPAGLAGSHLAPSGQGDSHQVWALLEVTLLSYYPMIVAPLLDPPCEAPEAIQVDASGLIKDVLDVGHKVQWMSLLKLQGFLLVLEEVIKEPLLDPGPVQLCKVVDIVFIVDLEDMLQVLPPSTTSKVCCQPRGITEGRPCPTSPLRLGSFRCWWWWWGTRC